MQAQVPYLVTEEIMQKNGLSLKQCKLDQTLYIANVTILSPNEFGLGKVILF